jgi:VWFA-related protein
MLRSRQIGFDRRVIGLLFLPAVLAFFACLLSAQTPSDPSPPPKTDSAQAPQTAQSSAPGNSSGAANGSEVSSHDTPTTFKFRVNLVLVRVVVRDAQGTVVPNLKKEDFQLFDNRKAQAISTFSVETQQSLAVVPAATVTPSTDVPGQAAPTPALPQRFVSVIFDDTDMSMEDTINVRGASTRLFNSLAPSDRVAIRTTSGQFTQEFTADHEALEKSLVHILPRPLASSPGMEECPEMSYYEADQIANFRDTQALLIATQDTVDCAFNGSATAQQIATAKAMAEAAAERTSNINDSQTDFVYRHLEDALRRLSAMPGQRVMVFISPGFLVTQHTNEGGDFIDLANRANVVINTIDARGLYTPDMGDISSAQRTNPSTAGPKAMFRTSAQFAQSAILGELADGTGGTFFHNRNDLDEGMRRAVVAPTLSYLLGFSPQNLKVDGHYHTLKVSLTSKQKLTLQARHGYYAPRTVKDPAETAKQEIQEAIFSQEEMHDVPIDLQTQFFKTDQTQARLAVLTHVDVKGIHFRKAEGRSHDDLTFATAIFDENGNYVTGGEKIVEMRLLDPTLNRLTHSGFTVKSSFDVKPGTYLVRLVVRDAEGAQMAARNGAVVIP